MMAAGKRNYRKGVMMSFQPDTVRALGARRFLLLTSLILALAPNAFAAFPGSGKSEVSPKYKSRQVGNLHLGAYKDELVECSALAGIHTWLDDNLGDVSGAEVRRKLAGDYWVETSKAYLDLAEQASGTPDLSKEMGKQMRELAVQYRTLTETPEGTADWTGWYDLIDRCDSWRVEKPAQAFFNNGRNSAVQAKQTAEVSRPSP
jgi:hypothetical protein